MQREVAFLAIDEIQLAADHERGHIFTERLLHARGSEETMFLGSDTIRPILRRLVPEAEVIGRPRFSILSFAGDSKLHRLPRRSAVVAFSAAEVYSAGRGDPPPEGRRRRRAAVPCRRAPATPRSRCTRPARSSTWSPPTRSAWASTWTWPTSPSPSFAKFDGIEQRRLRVPEMAQIAGRAGRHMANGSFGATNGCEPFEPREIEAIESHSFAPLKSLRWRNSELDFADVESLAASLDQAPPLDCLVKVRDAIDHRSLIFLSRRDDIRAAATSEERVRLLWQVCQIPDFRKTLTDAHLHLLATVYRHLTAGRGVLPNDWVGNMIAQLERFDGDIDALVTRIAHVRTWTYMSHRASWLIDPKHWQERAREVEDRLSDALHERLTQRFVDRRTSALMRSLRDHDEHAAVVDETGEIAVDGHPVGRIEGLNLVIVEADLDADRRLLTAAARRTALPVLRRKVAELVAAGDDAVLLGDDDTLRWQGTVVARLRSGAAVLAPRLQLELDSTLDGAVRDRVRHRLERWLDHWVDARLGALARLRNAASGEGLTGAGRGVAYRLAEEQGAMRRGEADGLIRDLVPTDRRALARLGVRFGLLHLYLPDLLKPAANEARARLSRIFHGRPQPLPPPGRTVLRPPFPVLGEAMLPLGFAVFDGFAVRIDILERIAAQVRARARGGASFSVPPAMAAEAGLHAGRARHIGRGPGLSAGGSGGCRRLQPASRQAPRRQARQDVRQVSIPPARRSPFWPGCGWRPAHDRQSAARQVAVPGALHPQSPSGGAPRGCASGAAERADRRRKPTSSCGRATSSP